MQEQQEEPQENNKEEVLDPAWRYGPASYWYDKHDDKIEGGKFNYGFKLKDVSNCFTLYYRIKSV